MSNIRLFFSESLSLNFKSELDKAQSHYLTKVMRIKIGANFSLFNSNEEWSAKIIEVSNGIVEFRVIEKLRQQEVIKEIETFVLWHYQNGSKYESPFWEYVKSIPFNPDEIDIGLS